MVYPSVRRCLIKVIHTEEHPSALTVNPISSSVSNGIRKTTAFGWIHAFWKESITLKKAFGVLLIGLMTVCSGSNSMGSVSVDEVIQRRIEMFKSSGKNIKALNKSIQTGDTGKAVQLMGFHVTWSEKMSLFFPLGSEASTLNGSDASSDIWGNPISFMSAIKQYEMASKDLQKALSAGDPAVINQIFKSFVGTCTACHKQFRN